MSKPGAGAGAAAAAAAAAAATAAAQASASDRFLINSLEGENLSQKNRLRELSDAHERLSVEHATQRGKLETYVREVQEKLARKDAEITARKLELEDVKGARDVELRRLKLQTEAALGLAVSDRRAAEGRLRAQLAEATERIERSRHQFEMQQEDERRLKELEAALAAEKLARKEEVEQLYRDMQAEKKAASKKHDAAYLELRRRAQTEAIQAMDRDKLTVMVENKHMVCALPLCAHAIVEMAMLFAR
jgi:hypothetical protein